MPRKNRRSARDPKRKDHANAQRDRNLSHDPKYDAACMLAEQGDSVSAERALAQLKTLQRDSAGQALLENDLGAAAALAGRWDDARRAFSAALRADSACEPARQNLAFLDELHAESNGTSQSPVSAKPSTRQPVRVAILSLLFNWPSTGGGTVHTAETGKFLARAGFEVRHIYAHFDDWGLGKVTEPTGAPTEALEFDASSWNPAEIRKRFRAAVDAFQPDYVIITDSWNTKPLLAEAVKGYRYFLRLAALECLCPLNNVRLLFESGGTVRSCPRQQLATPDACRQCVASNEHLSGGLHLAERALARFASPDYPDRLKAAFANAEGVLVVNPLIATMVAPFAREVHVVPSGFDSDRFPWPPPDKASHSSSDGRTRLFFAGLVEEGMKGFRVLQAACQVLWQKRQDFELIVTAEPPECPEPFARYIGWQSQADLPSRLRAADILVFPTVAEEALGRSAVEAMGTGIPVIASRIGGLPFTVSDGLTGLLFEPGKADDLASKIETLLDDSARRQQMGLAGRKRFEDSYTWDVIIDRHYRRLFSAPASKSVSDRESAARYEPHFVDKVDHPRLIRESAEFFGIPQEESRQVWNTVRDFSARQGYARTLGEWKTLSTEESYVLGLAGSLTRPPVIVELGAQSGSATRRIIDLVAFLGLDCRVVAYGDRPLSHVADGEVDFRRMDLAGCFREKVLDRFAGGVIFSDVHEFGLLKEIIEQTLDHFEDWTLILHDAGRGLCNPEMQMGHSDWQVTSLTGVWERHVLAELFGLAGPLSPHLDHHESKTHQLRIFETQHGLAVIRRLASGSSVTSRRHSPDEVMAE